MSSEPSDLERALAWMVFGGAVLYARKHFSAKMDGSPGALQRDAQWKNIWAMQRELKCPPVGLIRSV